MSRLDVATEYPAGPNGVFDWTEPLIDVLNPALDGSKAEAPSDLGMMSPLASSDGDLFGLQQQESAIQEEQASKVQQMQQPKRRIEDMLHEAPSRRKKKPKSLPKRPLSAYNIYFQQLRAELNAEGNQKVGFHDLGKIVGKKWQVLPDADRIEFQDLAGQDSERYRKEMEEHKKRETAKKEEAQKASSAPSFSTQDVRVPLAGNYGPSFGGGPQSFGPSYGSPPPYQFSPFLPPQQYPGVPPNWGAGPQSQFLPPSYAFDSRGAPRATLMEGQPKDGRPLPPGSEVQLRDETGELRKYTVQYAMVTMSRQEAKDYMESLKRT
mmetsp:Transcript_15656/g.26186  ORF Transcript_15656/g.26186 Transcript_15656/m.26186 type:complete len:322 (+) Transcript_15656:346-1311(+)